MSHAMEKAVLNRDTLIESLLDPSSYVHTVAGPVVVHETHISWVLLAGNFAYKIKKPIKTDFLDFGSLAKRHHACCEEFRLGNRYAMGMYLDIVPITMEYGQIRMDGDGQPIEFAVRMRRFDDGALMSLQLDKHQVSVDNMMQLATTLAGIHDHAMRWVPSDVDVPKRILDQAQQNLDMLLSEPWLHQDPVIHQLQEWTATNFEKLRPHFIERTSGGFVRECHGDLHCGNIVLWKGHWVPFDGIEFNPEFTWIDVMSDIAFVVMDVLEHGHPELSATFLNAYLEQTGDYRGLSVLRWYMVYRALVRAKVALLRARQHSPHQQRDLEQSAAAKEYIRLAKSLTESGKRTLWITHGVSGSGKTTASQKIVERQGAIRIRSDIERKRLFKTSHANDTKEVPADGMYSPTATEATYQRLYQVAKGILQSDFSAIVDATFLKQADRQWFHRLAESEQAEFRILDFQADVETLKQRITQRRLTSNDASDATLEILANQLKSQEPLTTEELGMLTDIN